MRNVLTLFLSIITAIVTVFALRSIRRELLNVQSELAHEQRLAQMPISPARRERAFRRSRYLRAQSMALEAELNKLATA